MIDRHLQALLLRERGDNRQLAAEVLEKLSPESKDRLYRLLQAMKAETEAERGKRRRGQFW